MKKFKLRIIGDLGFEVWQDIPEYEGIYQVSTYGRVRSVDHYVKSKLSHNGLRLVNGKILNPSINGAGYYIVMLSYRKNKTVHRLVAETFIPNPNNYPEVNHKDENKLSNLISNLEWCTFQYNALYGSATKKISDKLSKQVLQYDLNGNFINSHKSAWDIQRKICYNQSLISRCCLGKSKTAYGYIWKYA